MAANDELPRGWVLSQTFLTPAAPTITLPALPGIAHVLDEIDFTVETGTAQAIAITENSSGAAVGRIVVAPPASSIAESSWSGPASGAAGAALTVTGAALAAGNSALLTIRGHDI